MSTDKKPFTSAKRCKIAEIKETYNHVSIKAMIVKLVLGEKNIEMKVQLTTNGFFFKSIYSKCNPSSKTCHITWPTVEGYSNPYSKLVTCYGGTSRGGKTS